MNKEDQRTTPQNSSIHKWFEIIEQECTSLGQTMDMLIKNPTEVPITRYLLKDTFRLIGKVMYGKESTADLTKEEIDKVIKVFEKLIGERLEINILFPSKQQQKEYNEKNRKNRKDKHRG